MKRWLTLFAVLVTALAVAQQSPSPDQLLAQARTTYEQQGARPAVPLFEEALRAFRDKGDRHGEAIALGLLGNCYKHLGDSTRALDLLQTSLKLKHELHDDAEEAKTLNHLGLFFWEQGDYARATAYYESAVSIAQKLADPKLEGTLLNNLGLVHDEQGDYNRSLGEYKRALELHRKAGFERGESDTLGNLGGVYLNLGRYAMALERYGEALKIDERAELKPSAMQDMGNLALCYTALGRMPEALATFDRALAMAAEQGLRREEGDWHKGKGSALLQMGRYDAALKEYRDAELIYQQAGNSRQLAELLYDRGGLYLGIGDVGSADKDFKTARDTAQKIGYAQGALSASMALGEMKRRREQYEEARAEFSDALQRAQKIGDQANEAAALLSLAQVALEQRRFEQAEASARDAQQVAQRSGAPVLLARAEWMLGEVALARDQATTALEHYQAGTGLARSAADSELKWQLAYGEARALEQLQRFPDALAAYRRAVDEIESVRDQLQEERFRAGYLQNRYHVYIALVRLLMRMHKLDEAFSYAEKLRARSYLELLSREPPDDSNRELVELRSRIRRLESAIETEQSKTVREQRTAPASLFSDELEQAQARYQELLDDLRSRSPRAFDERAMRVRSRDDVSQSLEPTAAILEYVVGDHAIVLFVIRRDGLHGMSIPVRSADLGAKIELLRDLVSNVESDAWRGPAASLYRLLIAPAADAGWLRGVRRLYVVPHGILHYLPFALLLHRAGGSEHFLVGAYSIQYLPSASMLLSARQGAIAEGKLLAMAPAVARLRYATQEAEGIARLFPGKSVALVGTSATKQSFLRLAGQYEMVHLATHGYFNRLNPLFSGIQLQPEADDDGTVRVAEVLGLRLRAQLITLSACETALGAGYFADLPPGDEFVGMTRAFLSAGGSSVMATLWEVNDRSTVHLMLDFYHGFTTQEGGAALAAAQRRMAARGPYQHPYYWAAFVLTGTGH